MLPNLKGMHYSSSFQIISGISLLMVIQLVEFIGYDLPILNKNPLTPSLHASVQTIKSSSGSVIFNTGMVVRKCFKLFKTLFTIPWPLETCSFFLQGSDWICDFRRPPYKSPVIPNKVHKGAYICHICWNKLVHNGLDLLQIHNYAFIGNNMS